MHRFFGRAAAAAVAQGTEDATLRRLVVGRTGEIVPVPAEGVLVTKTLGEILGYSLQASTMLILVLAGLPFFGIQLSTGGGPGS